MNIYSTAPLSRLSPYGKISVFIIVPLIYGLLSVIMGRDVNWDLRNYHYYNAYAFLEHRLNFDIIPANVQTFLNPLGDLPFYLMVKHFPAWVAMYVFGFVHGLNLSLIVALFWKLARFSRPLYALIAGIGLVAVSGTAPLFIAELGNTMHDNLSCLFVLSAGLLLINHLLNTETPDRPDTLRHVCLAGLLMGFGVGLKPTIAVFAISASIMLCFTGRPPSRVIQYIFAYGLAGISGSLVSAGFWWWTLWNKFGNPFLPFCNTLFKSPYFRTDPVCWSSYFPMNWREYLAWPYIVARDGLRSNQMAFTDIRIALLYTLCLIWLVVVMIRKIGTGGNPSSRSRTGRFLVHPGNALLAFSLISYILWIFQSATYRFLIPLELLSPLCFLIVLDRLVVSRKLYATIVAVALVAGGLSFKPFNWGRIDYADKYFDVDSSPLDSSKNAVVVMLGITPMAFLIPELPARYRFVHPDTSLFINGDSGCLFDKTIRTLLRDHRKRPIPYPIGTPVIIR